MKSLRRRAHAFRDLLPILIVVGIVLTARSSLADHYHVPSGSMLPSLHVGDRIAVDKSAYGLRLPLTHLQLIGGQAPQRGDVVVFPSPETSDVLVKRVIAVGGDLVEVHGGRVSIDGTQVPMLVHDGELSELLDDGPHDVRLEGGGGPDFGPKRVPAGHVLVLGDNRGNSHDGRLFGFVANDRLLGRVVGVFVRNGRPTWRTP